MVNNEGMYKSLSFLLNLLLIQSEIIDQHTDQIHKYYFGFSPVYSLRNGYF